MIELEYHLLHRPQTTGSSELQCLLLKGRLRTKTVATSSGEDERKSEDVSKDPLRPTIRHEKPIQESEGKS